MEKIGGNVKHSFIGPLPAEKGIKGLSQKEQFLEAPERFGHFGPWLYFASR